MKRRNFFAAFGALIAGPMVAKSAEATSPASDWIVWNGVTDKPLPGPAELFDVDGWLLKGLITACNPATGEVERAICDPEGRILLDKSGENIMRCITVHDAPIHIRWLEPDEIKNHPERKFIP